MILSRLSHQEIIAVKDQLIDELRRERDYYRLIVLGQRSLPDVKADLSQPEQAVQPQWGAGWDEEEWNDYNNWCAMQVNLYGNGDAAYLERLYREQYGATSPSEVMRVD